ncbi:MAG: histidinol-phosphate transaminase [Verrucomicrobia bacterium]|nr:histidinol-phosphate transaminase [Verrucomicrobiota bacterium]MCH8513536.1 histidinol-phosphate transaminase [Kiritimatiellia bacterium]
MSSQIQLIPRSGIEGLAVYEPGRPLEEVARAHGLAPGALVKLASNENSLGPSPKAIEAMHTAASKMHLYPDGGAFYLRKALSEKLGVAPNMLLFGNGSNELIEFLGHVFLEPGTNLVMSQAAFIIYKLVGDAFGAETRMAPMRNFTHDLEAMAKLIDEDTRLVYVANPNNPTGTRVDNEQLQDFLHQVPPHVLVVLDEAYVELLPPDEQPDSIQWVLDGHPVLILRTFSKTYGLAGLRIGYALGSPTVLSLLNKFRQPFNVNAMALAAALAAIADDEHVVQTRALVREGLGFFERECFQLNLDTVPSSANFLLIRTGDGRRHFEAMQELGVIARPMDGYGLPEWLRITVGTKTENRRAIEVLKQVLAAHPADAEGVGS